MVLFGGMVTTSATKKMTSDIIIHVIIKVYLGLRCKVFFTPPSSAFFFLTEFFWFDFLHPSMSTDPVIVVSGKWVKKHRYVFNTDERGCIVLHLNEQSAYDEVMKVVMEDYGLEKMKKQIQIQLSYMFSNKAMKNMAHDTPPVYVSNTRQLQGFLILRKIDQLRLCAEITPKEVIEASQKDVSREKTKHLFSYDSDFPSEKISRYDGFSFCSRRSNYEEIREEKNVDRASRNQDAEDEVEEENEEEEEEEEDEFNTRFDVFDDPDGASSDDDNFSTYGEPPKKEDEDSPTLPPKKRPQTFAMVGSRGNSEFLRLEMSLIKLVVGQRYETKDELEKRLKLLALRDGFDFDVPVSDTNTLIVTCWVDGCRWRVRASTDGESPEFYVRIYDSEHTCSVTERSNRSRQATPDFLGPLYRDFLGDVGPTVRPKTVGVILNKQFGIKMEYWKSHRTLIYAREIELGTPESGFEELPSYLYMIRRANPGTVTRLQIDECGRFKYMFIAFGASKAGFSLMRKVVVVDGTFLHGKYKGTLLTALAQDGNFQIFPIAFGVVDTENDDSWNWFFTQLKVVIPDEMGLAIISDRHNSIGKAIGDVYPLASRGICTYHLYKNILVRFKGAKLFKLVKKAARCFRLAEFNAVFKEIEALHPELHGYLQRAGVGMWSRVHFPGERYNLMTTNIAESMNKALSGARSLPIVRQLESIRTMMTRWFAERRDDAKSMQTTLTRGVEKLLTARVSAAKLMTVQTIDAYHVQVTYGLSLHVVNLEAKRCTCRRFDIEKIPCVHAIAAAVERNNTPISLCSPYYFSDYLVNAYADSIMPPDSSLPIPEVISNQRCLPPLVRKPPGRPKNRMKSALEVALENKRPRKQHACSRCKQVGHNAKTCRL